MLAAAARSVAANSVAAGDQHGERHGGVGDDSGHHRLEQRSAEHDVDDRQGHHRDEHQPHGAAVEPIGGRRLVHPTSVWRPVLDWDRPKVRAGDRPIDVELLVDRPMCVRVASVTMTGMAMQASSAVDRWSRRRAPHRLDRRRRPRTRPLGPPRRPRRRSSSVELVAEHQVVFAREQHLDEEQHRTLATQFGELSIHPVGRLTGSGRAISVIDDTADRPPAGFDWHTDLSWTVEPPELGFLVGRRHPAVRRRHAVGEWAGDLRAPRSRPATPLPVAARRARARRHVARHRAPAPR